MSPTYRGHKKTFITDFWAHLVRSICFWWPYQFCPSQSLSRRRNWCEASPLISFFNTTPKKNGSNTSTPLVVHPHLIRAGSLHKISAFLQWWRRSGQQLSTCLPPGSLFFDKLSQGERNKHIQKCLSFPQVFLFKPSKPNWVAKSRSTKHKSTVKKSIPISFQKPHLLAVFARPKKKRRALPSTPVMTRNIKMSNKWI